MSDYNYSIGDTVYILNDVAYRVIDIAWGTNYPAFGEQTQPDLLILKNEGPRAWSEPAYAIYDRACGICHSYANGIDLRPIPTLHERTFETWNKLDRDLRAIIIAAGKTKKISAVKYLRLLTGLGLSEAKYAVETFES